MTLDDLLRLPLAELADALVGLTEKERKALAPAMRERRWGRPHEDGQAHYLLAFGILNGAKQVAAAVEFSHLDVGNEDLAVRVLGERRPAWLAALPEALGRGDGNSHWRVVRALERAGLVEPVTAEWYVAGLATGLCGWGWYDIRPRVIDMLRADQEVLDRHFWAMLAAEGGGGAVEWSDGFLAGGDDRNPRTPARPEHTWRYAVTALIAEGRIDRERLLDTTLGTFLRDWRPQAQAWAVEWHAFLDPTTDELAAREGTYARLLAAAHGPVVKLAQAVFGRLLDAGRLDAETFLAATPAVLQRPDKGTVLAQLKLLARLRAARPDLAGSVADAARVALDHEKPDVRERAAALVPAAPVATVAEPLAEVAVERAAPVPVAPVADADELAELFARLVEEAADPVEVERALEGAARLARARPLGAEALARRAAEQAKQWPGPWAGQELRADLAQLALVWLTGAEPGERYSGAFGPSRYYGAGDRTLAAVVSWRVHEVATLVAHGGGVLLSAPVTSDGAIPAAVLTERLRALGRATAPAAYDVAVAALRVPPAEYGSVRPPAAHRAGRAAAAAIARLAAYAPQWERVVGWQPPARTWRDHASTPASADDALSIVLDRSDPLAVIAYDASDGEFVSRFDQVVAQWPLLLPHHPELLAAHAHARLHRGLDRNRAASGPLLDALARSTVRTGPVTCSALAVGLAAKNAAERTRAVDALVDLAAAGLLDAPCLGREVLACLADGVVVGGRVAASLADAARAGRRPARAVVDALRALLPALPGRRDAAAFVEVLAEVAAATGERVTLPEEFAKLAAGRATSVLAAACRRVPA
ncbi:MAG TPA: DUF6493 family protein [Frankiaceae bacterium]|nr:DUF6493 family protein [Frankiaceae bacterium]